MLVTLIPQIYLLSGGYIFYWTVQFCDFCFLTVCLCAVFDCDLLWVCDD